MSEIQCIVDSLRDSDTAAARLKNALLESPQNEILLLNATAVAKRRTDLLRRLDYTLHTTQHELIQYRIIRDWSDSYPVKAVAASIAAFQDLMTAVFDAVRNGPKVRFRPSADTVELSSFQFAGAGAGSVIISLTVPNERLLVDQSDLDKAFGLVERTISARDSDDLKGLADIVGIASISKAYSWADASSSYGLDTVIRWGKSYVDSHEVAISRVEAQLVRELIESKSEEEINSNELDCILLGFDGATSYFHIETIGERLDIRGNLAPELSRSWTTGQHYRATLIKTTQIKYATGEEKTQWTLVNLSPWDKGTPQLSTHLE